MNAGIQSGLGSSSSRTGRALTGWVGAILAVQALVLLATSSRYGYHRDELYFVIAGAHPAFGYPDQPPLVPLLSQAMQLLAPGSLLMLRAPSTLAALATTGLAALIAREVGGARNAQILAGVCAACSGFELAVSHLVSTTTFDLLSTTTLGWLAIRAVMRRSGACLLGAGVVVGLGVEAKPQVGLVAAVMLAVLFAVGPRSAIRPRWVGAGAGAAALLAAPYLLWQGQHGWPQLTVAGNIAGSQEGGRAGFVPFQLVMVSPLLVPVWVAGLLAPFRRSGWRDLRFIPITYLAMAVLYLLGNGHAYYLASLYPILLGLGALPAAEWVARARRRGWLLAAAVVLSALVSAVIALPLLPERKLNGSIVMGLNPAQGETVGWPRFVDTVSSAWRRIPQRERIGTAIFAGNYGEAGAIDLLGNRRVLPQAFSAHNGFSEWGIPPDRDTHALLLGYESPREAAPYFDGCRPLGRVDNGVGLENDEQGLPVLYCRTAQPWSTMWPHLRHFD